MKQPDLTHHKGRRTELNSSSFKALKLNIDTSSSFNIDANRFKGQRGTNIQASLPNHKV